MSNISVKLSSYLMMTACAGALTTGITVAQDMDDDKVIVLDEIIVTSQLREQSLQDVPISVAAVSGEVMREQGIQKLDDLQFSVPNFTMTETGISTNISIRGIFSGINQGFEQSVGMYIDGIHMSRGQQARMPFLDVERVEVLRGPQSILFGKNSVAGALNIVSAKPTSEAEGYASFMYEFENKEYEGTFVASGPLSDKVRARMAVRFHELDGYLMNSISGQMEPNRKDWNVRGTVAIDASEDLEIILKADIADFDVTGRHIETAFQGPSAHPAFTGATYAQILTALTGDARLLNNTIDGIRTSNGDFSENKSENFTLTMNYQTGAGMFTSLTGWSEFEYDELCDCDYTGADIFNAALQEKYRQFSQEFRLVSPGGEKVDYIVGAYFQDTKHNYGDQILVSSGSVLGPLVTGVNGLGAFIVDTSARRAANVESKVYSAFGQATFNTSDNMRITAGMRVTNEKKVGTRALWLGTESGADLTGMGAAVTPLLYGGLFGILPHSVDGSRSETKFTPSINMQYNSSDNTMLYASWAQGFKSGGFDFRANNPGPYASFNEAFEFEDEKADTWEIGMKSSMAGGRAEINIAGFYTEFKDLQISIFDGTLGFNVGNAATARVYGLEADGRYALSENFTLRGSIALTDFKFKSFPNGQCYYGQTSDAPAPWTGLCDYSGKTNQMVSDVQGTLGLDYERAVTDELTMTASFDMFATSEYHAAATLDPTQLQDGYAKLNARVALSHDDGWEIAVLGKNLTNEQIILFGGNSPLAGSTFVAKSHYNFMSPGRTVAVQATMRF